MSSLEANAEIYNEANYEAAQRFKKLNLELSADEDSTGHRHYVDRRAVSRAMRLFLLEKEMRELGKDWSFKTYSARDDDTYFQHMIELDENRVKVMN